MHLFEHSKIQLLCSTWLNFLVQGALVGSYKGSCHLYNTSGTVRDFFIFQALSIHLFSVDCGATDYLLVFIFHSENKLQQKSKINLQNKKKKSHHKKITGFQVM